MATKMQPAEKTEKPDARTEGVVEMDTPNTFAYYPQEGTKCNGREIDYFHLRKPKLRNLRGSGVSVGENMSAQQMANIAKACCLRIVATDGDEFPSSKRQSVFDELYSDDLFPLAKECISRFFERQTD